MNRLYIGPNSDSMALKACADYLECEVEELAMKSDVLIISPNEKGKILVEDIQEVYRMSSLATGSEKGRVCVITGMAQASVTVQNKLLKVLEDGKMCFFLGTSNERNVLDTIKSRCVSVHEEQDAAFEQYIIPFQKLKTRRQLLSNLHLSKEKDPLNFYEVNKGDIRGVLLSWQKFLYECFESENNAIRGLFGDKDILEFLVKIDNAIKEESFTKDDFFYIVANFVK